MSEFSKKSHFSNLLLSDLFLFCSFILSHPLYFLYFIFFFPYLFKLLSFLSPLFFTTFLLLSVFLTFSPNETSAEFAESKLGFLVGAYQAVVERLKSKIDDNGEQEIDQFEELEVYKSVFDTSDFDLEQNLAHYIPEIQIKETISTTEVVIPNGSDFIDKEEVLGVFSHQKEGFDEDDGPQKEVKAVKETISEEQCIKRVSNELECQLPKANSENATEKSLVISTGFDSIDEGNKLGAILHQIEEQKQVKAAENEEQYLSRENSERSKQNPWEFAELEEGEMFGTPKSVEQSPSMRSTGSYGSMRKEKEWRRTLACKLFEERHNSDGSEGMDSLWETYETDSVKLQAKSKSKRGKKMETYSVEDEDYDDDEDEEQASQLCCLQALKFSTGKMNLGMRRPNLVKISKAFKGIGWLHHVTKKKTRH